MASKNQIQFDSLKVSEGNYDEDVVLNFDYNKILNKDSKEKSSQGK